MPGGVCAQKDIPHGGYSRVAEVVVRAMGVTRTLRLGGAAEAFFPDRSDDDLRDLKAGDAFRLVWRDSVFFGRDGLIGDVQARLVRGPGAAETSGTVKSLASPPPGIAPAASGLDFFPAVNVNRLHFELSVPRFGLWLGSSEPIVNQATIKQIPPLGSVYKLEQPVSFAPIRERSSWFGALAPSFEIQTCNIRLIVHGGMTTTVRVVHEEQDEVEFEAEVINESVAGEVEASWMLWPRPPQEHGHPMGVISLARAPVKFRFRCNRNIFYEPRWFVVSGTTPFENDAAAAARMPALA